GAGRNSRPRPLAVGAFRRGPGARARRLSRSSRRPAQRPANPLGHDLQEPRRSGRRHAAPRAQPAPRPAAGPPRGEGSVGRGAGALRAQGALRLLRRHRLRKERGRAHGRREPLFRRLLPLRLPRALRDVDPPTRACLPLHARHAEGHRGPLGSARPRASTHRRRSRVASRQLHAALGPLAGARVACLPLAPGDRPRHVALRRLRVGLGVLHQPHAARGCGGLSAKLYMKILFASSEVSPFSMTGGLGDVAYALPVALAKRGHDVVVLSPLYGCVDRRRHGLEPVAHDPMDFRLWLAPEKENMRFAFVEAQLFDREGVYGGYEGDYADNAARFAFFSRRLLRAAQALGFSPQILHLNDWQTAPGTLLGRPEGPRTVLTIHNLGYQGHFPLEEARHLFDDGLVPAAWTHWGKLALLRGGICTADLVTTVSPTYAREIRDTELSFGLGEELRALGDRLVGILNGIDVEAWNPATDPHLPAHFS